MRNAVSLLFAFVLGACAATTAQSMADGRDARVASATVIHLDDAEMREVGGGKASIRFLARGKNAFIGRLEMAAGGKVAEHRDATEEYIHVLAGGGTIYIEGKATQLRAGSTVYMPANAKVRYENGPEPMVALQVFAGPGPAAKYDKWAKVSAK